MVGQEASRWHRWKGLRSHDSRWSTGKELREDPHEFSPVLGGPFFQLLRRSHLTGDAMELLHRRMVVIPMIAWLPLMLLVSLRERGLSFFLHDVEVHVRLLIALPILIAAEIVVHSRMRPAERAFVNRRIVMPDDLPRFDKAIESAIQLRNSYVAELILVILVYTFGLWLWNSRFPIVTPTWYAMPGGRWHLTPAGYWYVFVSIPIVQFVLLRWYLRLFIWYRFLWQVSRSTCIWSQSIPIAAQGSLSWARVHTPSVQFSLPRVRCLRAWWRVASFTEGRACCLSSYRSAALSFFLFWPFSVRS